MTKKIKTFLRCFSLIFLIFLIFMFITPVFERKTVEGPWNYTTKVNGYINSKPNSIDVVGFGSSHMYCTINPLILEEEYNISSYVLATQQQPIKASYYYMLEALKQQNPKIFILETYMVNRTATDISDSIIADATEPLPWSINKIRLITSLTSKKKDKLPFYLTLFKYAKRWKELTDVDFEFNPEEAVDPYKGYVYLTESKPIEQNLFHKPPKLQNINNEDKLYLEKIISLCKEKNIRLILLYAPFALEEEDYNMNFTMKEIAKEKKLEYIDGYNLSQKIEFNFEKDFYDRGHLNYNGSLKFTRYLGDYLSKD